MRAQLACVVGYELSSSGLEARRSKGGAEDRRHRGGAQHSQLGRVWMAPGSQARSAMNSETVKPMPPMAAIPTTMGRVDSSGRRPRPVRTAKPPSNGDPDELADDEAEHHAGGDPQGGGGVEGVGLDDDAAFGHGEDGHDHEARPRVQPVLELAHHPATKERSYDDYLGRRARRKLGNKHWNRRVRKALVALDALVCPDSILLGGGDSTNVKAMKTQKQQPAVAAKVAWSATGGLLGRVRLWEHSGLR